jgi:hypothetical protein
MRIKVVAATVIVLGFAMPGVTQVVGDMQFFPVVAHTRGAGDPPTAWRSDVTVHNPNAQQITVGFQYFAADQPNIYDFLHSRTVVLESKETVTIEDVVPTVFGILSDSMGALLLECHTDAFPGNPEEAVMYAASRTYNAGSPEGTYGLSVAYTDAIFNMGQAITLITGIRHDERYRTNLGIVNISPSFQPITVHYRILDQYGAQLAIGSRDVYQLSMNQWTFKKLGIRNKPEGPLTMELWLDPDDVSENQCDEDELTGFVAYATKIDGNPEGTGDSEFLYGAPIEEFDPYCPDD